MLTPSSYLSLLSVTNLPCLLCAQIQITFAITTYRLHWWGRGGPLGCHRDGAYLQFKLDCFTNHSLVCLNDVVAAMSHPPLTRAYSQANGT
ncbi:hypothetical protein C8R44DRAFT_346563 [Mycena epipterygia]|nr:hypothetical protein C8R44DRAFT_346563 [Mycena epipterygia]